MSTQIKNAKKLTVTIVAGGVLVASAIGFELMTPTKLHTSGGYYASSCQGDMDIWTASNSNDKLPKVQNGCTAWKWVKNDN